MVSSTIIRSTPLVSKPRRAITDIDDTAFSETILLDLPLHGFIVRMRINSDVCREVLAVIRGTPKQSMHLSIARYPMDCDVGLIVQPLTVLYIQV